MESNILQKPTTFLRIMEARTVRSQEMELAKKAVQIRDVKDKRKETLFSCLEKSGTPIFSEEFKQWGIQKDTYWIVGISE